MLPHPDITDIVPLDGWGVPGCGIKGGVGEVVIDSAHGQFDGHSRRQQQLVGNDDDLVKILGHIKGRSRIDSANLKDEQSPPLSPTPVELTPISLVYYFFH